MKKTSFKVFRILVIIIILAIGFIGCSNKSAQTEDRQNVEVWKYAVNGNLPGIDVKIGALKKEVLGKLGTPQTAGHSEFAYRLEYPNYWLDFRVNGVLKSLDELPNDSVLEAITVKPDFVNWQGTTNDVIAKLGKPDQEFNDEAYGPAWNQVYKVTDHIAIYFIAEAKGKPVTKIRLQNI